MHSAPLVTDDEIQKVLELKPQIKLPFRLGVYFTQPQYRYFGWNGSQWSEDQQSVEWLDQLKTRGIVSDVVPISSATVESSGSNKSSFRKDVRLAAARHNADAVLIIDYNYGVDRYNNYSALLYLTIVGGYVIPGTHSDALVIMNGTLWDVRNEYLYLTAETDATAKRIGPAFILEDEESVKLARVKALKQLKDEILRRMANMKS